jgi:hypothetical protein
MVQTSQFRCGNLRGWYRPSSAAHSVTLCAALLGGTLNLESKGRAPKQQQQQQQWMALLLVQSL